MYGERGNSMEGDAMPERNRTNEDLPGTTSDKTVDDDEDQTRSEADQTASDRDQAASEADQAASDRDQRASDREFDAAPGSAASRQVHADARAERMEGTLHRDESTRQRVQTGSERDERALQRDQAAILRDRIADQRDRTAEQQDREEEELEEQLITSNVSSLAALDVAAAVRARGAADRARAAANRARAARDRDEAKQERDELQDELRRSGLDELTGAYRRGMGANILEHEIERARRSDVHLVLAFVDVDSLKSTNDDHGHDAGDALLRDVASSLRAKLRAYDPIARWGGDEFVCAISEIGLESARDRLTEAGKVLNDTRPGASISVGLADLRQDDTLTSLIERADQALIETKRRR
jgi:diguanylate cyclase (GGDEF)-like protein